MLVKIDRRSIQLNNDHVKAKTNFLKSTKLELTLVENLKFLKAYQVNDKKYIIYHFANKSEDFKKYIFDLIKDNAIIFYSAAIYSPNNNEVEEICYYFIYKYIYAYEDIKCIECDRIITNTNINKDAYSGKLCFICPACKKIEYIDYEILLEKDLEEIFEQNNMIGNTTETLKLDEQTSNLETWKHINTVNTCVIKLQNELNKRLLSHDRSKLESPEVEIFSKFTSKLKNTTYGSIAYNTYLKEMEVALNHHYANNKHHPEHFEHGIDDMDLIDILEMICDWKASTLRHQDGDIIKSLEYNSKRFNMSPQLVNILKNTLHYFEN